MKKIVWSLLVAAMAITGCNQTPVPETSVNPQSSNAVTLCDDRVTLQTDSGQAGSALPTDPNPGNGGGGGGSC